MSVSVADPGLLILQIESVIRSDSAVLAGWSWFPYPHEKFQPDRGAALSPANLQSHP
jgi:hypothetical protein